MKKIILFIFITLCFYPIFSQVSGNANYNSNYSNRNKNFNVEIPRNSKITVGAKGLFNLKANSFVAVFSVSQTGKTAEDVNNIIDQRINNAIKEIKLLGDVEIYVDMISFVPIYNYETEKKIFSKTTYNEIPKGFELKKNIHIKYYETDKLKDIISILSKSEIYDIVKVDYFSDKIDESKKELVTKAQTIIVEKMKFFETILGKTFNSNNNMLIVDGFNIFYPTEMYNSYEAFSSTILNVQKSSKVNQYDKSLTMYYQPFINKDFDFVINPSILEPVIQIVYEIKVSVDVSEKDIEKINKNYILITPNGELKNLNLE